MLVDSSTSNIVAGDFLVEKSQGYVEQAAAGGLPVGVAWESVSSPSSDGDASVQVSIHPDTIYEYPADTGTVGQTLCNRTVDIGGAQSIDIDASTDDVIHVISINTTRNSVFCKLIPTIPTFS